MTVDIHNLKNEIVGKIELPDNIFGAKWKPSLIAQVLRAQLANARKPWSHAKTRSEVRGGGKKPWRQKGTGRARHGSIRSPLWIGGGKAHGPSKERDYSQKVNKKMSRLAIFVALSRKLKDGEVKIFDSFELEAPKTKILSGALKKILNKEKKSKKFDVLFVADKENKAVFRASKNLLKTKTISGESLNLYDILNHKNVFIEKNAVSAMAGHSKN